MVMVMIVVEGVKSGHTRRKVEPFSRGLGLGSCLLLANALHLPSCTLQQTTRTRRRLDSWTSDVYQMVADTHPEVLETALVSIKTTPQ